MAKFEYRVDGIEEDCPLDASFGTKRNALVGLKQMCEHVYTAHTLVGERIRASLTDPSSMGTVILRILRGMTGKQLDLLGIQGPDEDWLYETASLLEETAKEGPFCDMVTAVRLVGGPRYNARDQVAMKKEPVNGMAKPDEDR